MPRNWQNYSHSPLLTDPLLLTKVEESPEPGDALTTIFALLKSTTGVDFSNYKPTTIARRIQRRMVLYKLESLDDYAENLRQNSDEVKALYEEILIHVTSFFRDPEAFEKLKKLVFPTITQNKSANAPIRIWVAGCSTGEEVYSIAICLLEFLGNRVIQPPIQIFATDISEGGDRQSEVWRLLRKPDGRCFTRTTYSLLYSQRSKEVVIESARQSANYVYLPDKT